MNNRKLGQQDGLPLYEAAVFHAQLPSQNNVFDRNTIFKIRDSKFARLFLIHKSHAIPTLLNDVGTWKRRKL
jgi:hypothetical protein